MKSETKYCDHCGAKVMEYRLSLNRGHVSSLSALAEYGKANIAQDLGLTTNQITNFARMKHWGLISHCYNDDGSQHAGWWQITQHGYDFLAKRCAISKWVWTFRDRYLRSDGPDLMVSDIIPGYEQRVEYAATARQHDFPALQRRLF